MIRRSSFPAHKAGRLWKFKKAEVDDWVQRHPATEPPSSQCPERPVPAQIKLSDVDACRLGPMALPLDAENLGGWDSSSLAAGLASLGYPGFRQLAGVQAHNPATILLAAVAAAGDVEVRVLEALPWLAVQYHDLNWEWLIREAKLRDVQNRLGFVVMLARQVADKRGDIIAADRLHEVEEVLDRARLGREDTLCQESLNDAERRWLRRTRPIEASRWNLLTDLKAELLPYAALHRRFRDCDAV